MMIRASRSRTLSLASIGFGFGFGLIYSWWPSRFEFVYISFWSCLNFVENELISVLMTVGNFIGGSVSWKRQEYFKLNSIGFENVDYERIWLICPGIQERFFETTCKTGVGPIALFSARNQTCLCQEYISCPQCVNGSRASGNVSRLFCVKKSTLDCHQPSSFVAMTCALCVWKLLTAALSFNLLEIIGLSLKPAVICRKFSRVIKWNHGALCTLSLKRLHGTKFPALFMSNKFEDDKGRIY